MDCNFHTAELPTMLPQGGEVMRKSQKVTKKLQHRHMRAGRMLLKGMAQAEAARRVGVTRTTVSV